MLKVVFMGTPHFAVPVLEKLNSEYEIVGVITQPDRARGRGKRVSFSPVKKKALELGLVVLQPLSVRKTDFLEILVGLRPDLIVVAAYGQILPREILELPKFGCLNIHASLLPRYRGAAPLQRVIMAGEKQTGVTIMLMDEGLDTGPLLSQKEIEIGEWTTGKLHDHLAVLGAELLMETLPLWIEGKIKPKIQEGKVSYAQPLTKADEKINWANGALMIYNQIRALSPRPGAFTFFGDQVLKIFAGISQEKNYPNAVPGEVVALSKGKGFGVQTGEGTLFVKKVQPAGKKIMAAGDFINGYHLEVGYVFSESRTSS
ncbi:MAG TPA: methionyl-tRNA formyltransferase [Clostridia bacterium]|nr:methionyl-tRNA formyltransferase [Clostridia bacterium]